MELKFSILCAFLSAKHQMYLFRSICLIAQLYKFITLKRDMIASC
jgi:hypothetical protein